MSNRTLQQRIATLEARLRQVEDQLRAVRGGQGRDWRRAVETFAGDPDLLAVFREAQRLRSAERRRATGKRKAPRRDAK